MPDGPRPVGARGTPGGLCPRDAGWPTAGSARRRSRLRAPSLPKWIRQSDQAPSSVLRRDIRASRVACRADAGVGALPVVQDDGVIGVITDRDLVVRAMAHGLSPALRVEEVMSGDPVTVEPDTPVAAALHAMRSIKARHLPVVDEGGRLVGMVSFDDLFSYLSVELGALAEVVNAVRKTPGPFGTR
ncbi:CBS domain-containing protein [Streptomyces roseifaciens]